MKPGLTSRVRSSVVVVHRDRILTFRAVDPTSGEEYYFLPGGKIEEDETAPESAERETLEETGFRVRVVPTSNTDREYVFHWNGEDFDCLTIFYWATLISPIQTDVRDAEYNKGTHWVPLSEVGATFSYKAEILSAIQEILERYANGGQESGKI